MKDVAIKENHLYNKAFKNGDRAASKHICVYVLRDWASKRQMLQNPEKKFINRVGLSVTKKIGGAVERNRSKRIIRAGLAEARKHGELKTGYLIVISARVGCADATSHEIADELISAFVKLRMYKRTDISSENTNDNTNEEAKN